MKTLHTAAQWETANINNYVFLKMYFSLEEAGKVILVEGKVTCLKKIISPKGNRYMAMWKRVRWNASGHCYMGTHNMRKRDFDIHF